MRSLEGSLRRLRTDYVDVDINHAVHAVRRMENEEGWEFTEPAGRFPTGPLTPRKALLYFRRR